MSRKDILYVDDEPNQLMTLAERHGLRNRFFEFPYKRAPANAKEIATRANLWVFDFYNDSTQIDTPDLAGRSSNGLAVFQQLRLIVNDARPPAVLISHHLERALGVPVIRGRRHILAEQLGIEWIAAKQDATHSVVAELASIADATLNLRKASETLQSASHGEYISQLAAAALKLPVRASWAETAIREIATWRPPIWIDSDGDVATAEGRSAAKIDSVRPAREVVTWMLRQILPYSSFLIRDVHIAVRLGVTLTSLREALGGDTLLANVVRRLQYKGILRELVTPLWWSAGVDDLAWEISRETGTRASALTRLFSPVPLDLLTALDPVVVSDADLVETDEIDAAVNCVRATDEFFPSQAAPAWVRIAAIKNDAKLARRVLPDDRAALESL